MIVGGLVPIAPHHGLLGFAERIFVTTAYVEASQRFVKLTNDFLDRLAASGDAALADLPRGVGPETGFRVRSRLFYTELWGLTGRGLLGWLADLVRSHTGVRRSVERDVGEYLERIVKANASRIQGDFRERCARVAGACRRKSGLC
jgi:hypothetical protein